MLADLRNDIRYAARTLRRSPGFAAAAIVTIALGVGVNTGIFTLLNGALLRDLPAPAAHELVSIYQAEMLEGAADRRGFPGIFSTAEYEAYRDRTQTLSGILGHSDPTRATLGGEAPLATNGLLVTCSYFDVLRQPPVLGRALAAQDCATGANPVVVLGHELWTTAFEADPAVLGRTIILNRQSFTVIGIASAGTYGGFVYDSAFFAPISAEPLLLPNENSYANDRASWLFLVGRRSEGVSLDQVRAELGVIAAQIDAQQPGSSTTLSIERATPFSIPQFRIAALGVGGVVMTAFGLVLLIACANVANLLLARGAVRGREIALRLSLGASRARVIQQLLTESVLVAIAGSVLGSILALWSFQALLAFALPSISPVGIPRLVLDASPDIRVLSVALTLTFGTGILFGLAPAWYVSKPDLHTVMKHDSSGVGSRRAGRLQGTLVGVQVALCMVLMLGAGLLLRGLSAAHTADPGFLYDEVAVASYDLAGAGYGPEEAAVFQRRLLAEVEGLPGVETAAYARREPLSSGTTPASVRLPDQDERQAQRAERNEVTPDYFALVGIPIVQGRTFTGAEVASDAPVAIVTETTARNYWPGQDPIGQTLLRGGGPGPEVALQVVGVAKDAQVATLGAVNAYYLYLPAAPSVLPRVKLLVRSRADFGSTAAAIRAAVRRLDSGIAVRVDPLQANLQWWQNLSGFLTVLAGSLGTLALVLAAVGIYGVVSYLVTRRVREIGIRMSLGATPRNVLGLMLRRTMRPVVVGAAIGAVAAIAAAGVLSSVLFGVSPLDPFGLGGAALVVLGVAFAAGVLAVRPATGSEPIAALRHD